MIKARKGGMAKEREFSLWKKIRLWISSSPESSETQCVFSFYFLFLL